MIAYRLERARHIGEIGATDYTSVSAVQQELVMAEGLYQRHGLPVVSATGKPVETLAAEVLA
jgi:regulator of PEP synthase PpsR (kinase-PPPase family)